MARISLSTGSEDLNNFLHGYPIKGITAIYGEPATGKTTAALLATITQLKNNKKVIYMDTENTMSIIRLKQLFPEIENRIQNLIKIRPSSFEEQDKIIKKLPNKNISLIVIDTISFFYRLAVKEDYKKANEMLINQIEKLKEIAENKIPVILTNQIYQLKQNEIKIVSGKILSERADLLIQLKKTPRALIIKKPERENNKLLFEIKNEGIFKK